MLNSEDEQEQTFRPAVIKERNRQRQESRNSQDMPLQPNASMNGLI